MRSIINNLRAADVILEDKAEIRMAVPLGIGVLVGVEFHAVAVAVLHLAEKAYPEWQADWDDIRYKLGLEVQS